MSRKLTANSFPPVAPRSPQPAGRAGPGDGQREARTGGANQPSRTSAPRLPPPAGMLQPPLPGVQGGKA